MPLDEVQLSTDMQPIETLCDSRIYKEAKAAKWLDHAWQQHYLFKAANIS